MIKMYRDGFNAEVIGVDQHEVVHSPAGFEWGYNGSGPADLAYNILLMFTSRKVAYTLHQDYKREVIANIPYEGGEISELDVQTWLNKRGKMGAHQ